MYNNPKVSAKISASISGYESSVVSYHSIFCLLYRDFELQSITLNEMLQSREKNLTTFISNMFQRDLSFNEVHARLFSGKPEISLRTEVTNAWINTSTLFFAITARNSGKHRGNLALRFTANTLFCHSKTSQFSVQQASGLTAFTTSFQPGVKYRLVFLSALLLQAELFY